MASVALASRIVLAATLVAAAVGKLRARDVTRTQMRALLGAAGDTLAIVVPVAELAVAVALLVWWGPVPGIVATVMLLAFTVVLVRAQNYRLPCACFGIVAADAAPSGGRAVLRNAVLVVLAVLATGSPEGASTVATVVAVFVAGAATAAAVRAAH